MTPEFKKMIGNRLNDSDGFTYIYGRIKDGSSNRPSTATTKRCVRADKRAVRNKELKRMLSEGGF
jgi:hypothetical protein